MHDALPSHDAPVAPGSDVAYGATSTPVAEIDPLAGTPYKVIAKIGEGGMGAVLEAEHRALGKRVVVKLLLQQFARDPRLVERLEREARVLARVASPYLVTVSDLGQTADGATFLVMERLDGHTLGRELKQRGALPVAEALRWTRQILLGLAAAHRAGIIHRDVKPENIFLCDATEHEPRRIKMLDFGIAKVLNGGDGSRHHPTAEGTFLGSPRWLAPEQALGKQVDARVDVYSVGLVLYSLVVGRNPFARFRDPIDAIKAGIGERPPLPSHCAPQRVPPDLDDVIMMAIEKAPEHRFQSAEAFAVALESVAHALADATQPLPEHVPVKVFSEPLATEVTAPTLPVVGGRVAAPESPPNLSATPSPPAPLPERGAPSLGVFLGATAVSAAFVTAVLAVALHIMGRL